MEGAATATESYEQHLWHQNGVRCVVLDVITLRVRGMVRRHDDQNGEEEENWWKPYALRFEPTARGACAQNGQVVETIKGKLVETI